ncbi:DUF1450 domain-containing protein [Halomicroarcula sp. GCM10025324]|uniref:DUF1450 domain-containing protein n=1 Tax=Haloarcula TaxID=2237 RepID=UPI0023E76179|nr:DUF1450 domain-containing protein [Halomicroarcula sp. ZS-22-S1]
MPSTVEYCLSSRESAVISDIDVDELDICERRCLEQCGICRDRQFAVVDGRPVSGTELSAVLADLVGSEGD